MRASGDDKALEEVRAVRLEDVFALQRTAYEGENRIEEKRNVFYNGPGSYKPSR